MTQLLRPARDACASAAVHLPQYSARHRSSFNGPAHSNRALDGSGPVRVYSRSTRAGTLAPHGAEQPRLLAGRLDWVPTYPPVALFSSSLLCFGSLSTSAALPALTARLPTQLRDRAGEAGVSRGRKRCHYTARHELCQYTITMKPHAIRYRHLSAYYTSR